MPQTKCAALRYRHEERGVRQTNTSFEGRIIFRVKYFPQNFFGHVILGFLVKFDLC